MTLENKQYLVRSSLGDVIIDNTSYEWVEALYENTLWFIAYNQTDYCVIDKVHNCTFAVFSDFKVACNFANMLEREGIDGIYCLNNSEEIYNRQQHATSRINNYQRVEI